MILNFQLSPGLTPRLYLYDEDFNVVGSSGGYLATNKTLNSVASRHYTIDVGSLAVGNYLVHSTTPVASGYVNVTNTTGPFNIMGDQGGLNKQEVADAATVVPTGQSQALFSKAGGNNTLPVNQTPVPKGRTVILQHTSSGLKGEFSKTFNIGEDKLLGVDFRKDMATNQRFASVVNVELESGTTGGITFSSGDQGVDGTVVKFKATAVTAGTYVVKITVTYAPNGEAAEGLVTMVVV